MIFDPLETNRFRDSTIKHAMTPGIQFRTRKCCQCGKIKQSENGKYSRGTSRHNPGRFTCFDCIKDECND